MGENEFGKITWLDAVDLRGLNLDEVVTIKKGMVEVYKDDEDSISIIKESIFPKPSKNQ